MKRKSIKISLKIQHLLLYIMLFTIPVLILGYIIHFYLVEDLQNEVMLSNDEKLTQVKEFVDSKYVELHNISSTISTKREFSPNYLTSYYKVMQAKELLNYKIADEFIHDIFYYSRENGYLFSYNTSYTLPVLYNNHYKYVD